MDAASLIQLAKPRGIDFKQVAGTASNVEGVAALRRLTRSEVKERKETHSSLDVQETVRGKHSRTYRRPAWSVAELGQAAKGLGVIPWTAALYSFAGARDGYWVLWSALAKEAHRLATREDWVPQVVCEDGVRRFYREKLAELVLDADGNKHLFIAAPHLYPACMGVAPEVWDRHLSTPYRSLHEVYDRWLSTARGAIGRWITAVKS